VEEKILEVLGRFKSLPYAVLRDLTLAGSYTFAAEDRLKLSLLEMKNAGKIVCPVGILGSVRLRSVGRREDTRPPITDEKRGRALKPSRLRSASRGDDAMGAKSQS